MMKLSDVITLDMVLDRVPALTEVEGQMKWEELLAELVAAAPCLGSDAVSEAVLVRVRGVALRALGRPEAALWSESVTTGPYSTKFRDGAAAAGLLTAEEKSVLRQLCGDATPQAGLPAGSFPRPGRLDRLFKHSAGW